MFSKNYVKLPKTEWEQIKKDYNELLRENKELKENQNDFLIETIAKQSEEIKKLLKYKEQDDLLYSYEKTVEEQNRKIKELENALNEAKKDIEIYRKAYEQEQKIGSLLLEKITESNNKCPEYQEVSRLDILA